MHGSRFPHRVRNDKDATILLNCHCEERSDAAIALGKGAAIYFQVAYCCLLPILYKFFICDLSDYVILRSNN